MDAPTVGPGKSSRFVRALARMLRAGSIALLTVTVTAFTPGSSDASPGDECDFCQDANGGPGWGHSFQSPGALFNAGGSHVAWLPGICGQNHGGCDAYDDALRDIAALEKAIEEHDLPALQWMLSRHPQNLSFNEERGAVQVRDCQRVLVAHFPVSDRLAAFF